MANSNITEIGIMMAVGKVNQVGQSCPRLWIYKAWFYFACVSLAYGGSDIASLYFGFVPLATVVGIKSPVLALALPFNGTSGSFYIGCSYFGIAVLLVCVIIGGLIFRSSSSSYRRLQALVADGSIVSWACLTAFACILVWSWRISALCVTVAFSLGWQ